MNLKRMPALVKRFIHSSHSRVTSLGTIRFDSNGIHRSWDYDQTKEDEVESIKNLAEYVKSHKIPQRYINVWTDDGRIFYNIRSFMFDPIHNRFQHYLVYPNWVKSSPRSSENTYWSISYEKASELKLDYHYTCVFQNVNTCSYCQGPNRNQIG